MAPGNATLGGVDTLDVDQTRDTEEHPLNQHEAPVGTIARVGHPANDSRIVKTGVGWIYLDTAKPVDPGAFRAGWDVVTAEELAGQGAPASP